MSNDDITRETITDAGEREIARFEAGHAYGNWYNTLTRRVVSRTACYVTFEGGLRKRVRVSNLGDGTYSEVVGPRGRNMRALKIWAAADFGE